MSAAAKAEARRRAILSRGTDRLSKLTTSARGEESPQSVPVHAPHPAPPPESRGNFANFIGEDPFPTRLASDQPSRPRPLDTAAGLGPDTSALLNEQHQQLLQALLGGPPPSNSRPDSLNIPVTNSTVPDDPLLAILSSLGGMGQGMGAVPQSRTEAKPRTLFQKLLPLLHVVAVWSLVAFFIFWREPEAFQTRNSAVVSSGNIWNRWARLGSGPAEQSMWGIEIVPFFWAFVSLELALNSTRIFYNFDSTQPPLLLSLALPHLPKGIGSMIVYGLRYLQLLGTLVDDLAAAVFAMGLFILASSIYENWSIS